MESAPTCKRLRLEFYENLYSGIFNIRKIIHAPLQTWTSLELLSDVDSPPNLDKFKLRQIQTWTS